MQAIHKKRALIKAATIAALGTIIVAFCAFAPNEEQAPARESYTETAIVAKMDKPAQDETLERVEEIAPVEELPICWREIPLDAEVQDYIVRKCDEMDISPAIVFAMIWRESSYRADAIGDNGAALGLLQIWPRWHSDRMERTGATNLLNPMHNVIVGMDYLAELLAKGKGVEWAISAYNNGATGADRLVAKGISCEYAASVLAEAGRIETDVLQRRPGA